MANNFRIVRFLDKIDVRVCAQYKKMPLISIQWEYKIFGKQKSSQLHTIFGSCEMQIAFKLKVFNAN